MTMTEKQKKFCDYFIETGNATKAAIFAGYSQKTAKQIGQQNLTKLDIKTYINWRMETIADNTIATAEETLGILTKIVRGERTEQVTTAEGEIIEKYPDTNQVIKASAEILKRYPLAKDININGNISTNNPFADLTVEELRALASQGD